MEEDNEMQKQGDRRLIRPERRIGANYINSYGNKVEHRRVMEQHLGRELRKDEIVHHINGDRRDNRIENLLLSTRNKHPREHAERKDLKQIGAENPKIFCKCGCAQLLNKYDSKNRPREFIHGHNAFGAHWVWGKNEQARA